MPVDQLQGFAAWIAADWAKCREGVWAIGADEGVGANRARLWSGGGFSRILAWLSQGHVMTIAKE